MEFQNIQTVQDMIQALENYPKHLSVAIFDETIGYVSVAFKKEVAEKDGLTRQWLTFYPNQEITMYSVAALIGYLQRLPLQVPLTIKDPNDQYSPLFLSIDSMEELGNSYQWLVISDQVTYQESFKNTESTDQEKALDKMFEELKDGHNPTLDIIHNWLCQQTELALFKGILKNDRTLEGAMAYCLDKAKEQAKNATSAMVEDDTVFQWVREYFLLEEVPKPKTIGHVATTSTKKKTNTDKQTAELKGKEVDEQISLFEMA